MKPSSKTKWEPKELLRYYSSQTLLQKPKYILPRAPEKSLIIANDQHSLKGQNLECKKEPKELLILFLANIINYKESKFYQEHRSRCHSDRHMAKNRNWNANNTKSERRWMWEAERKMVYDHIKEAWYSIEFHNPSIIRRPTKKLVTSYVGYQHGLVE